MASPLLGNQEPQAAAQDHFLEVPAAAQAIPPDRRAAPDSLRFHQSRQRCRWLPGCRRSHYVQRPAKDPEPPLPIAPPLAALPAMCSVRTMHRVLAENTEARERRNQLRHPNYTPPELLATAPNQLWSWDITKLLGPAKWTYYYLSVIIDVFSRYVVDWMVAHRESAALAQRLIAETCRRQGIAKGQLTLHADRGSSMTSKPVAFLLADMGVTKTHSRPHVSDDNPFSEANFKTLRYRPDFPDRFGEIEDARAHCRDFFIWYNDDHHHVGLGMLTPADVHYGRAEQRVAERRRVLDVAFGATLNAFHVAVRWRSYRRGKSGSTSRDKRLARRLRASRLATRCERRDRRVSPLNSHADCLNR